MSMSMNTGTGSAGGAGTAGEPTGAYAEHAQQQAWDIPSPAHAEWAHHTNAYQPEHADQDAHAMQDAYYQGSQGGQHEAEYANGYWHDYGYQGGAETQDEQQYQNWPADGQAMSWSAPAAEATPVAPSSPPTSKGPLGKMSKNVLGRFGKAAKVARA